MLLGTDSRFPASKFLGTRRRVLHSLCTSIALLVVSSCGLDGASKTEVDWAPYFVPVKYRDDPVDVGAPSFERLDMRPSSVVDDAWYDEKNSYLIIVLNGTAYHYCSVMPTVWDGLKSATSLGTFYNKFIKGRFDCRLFPVPEYPN